jgi:lantibiotic modifying enzyme
MVYGSSCDEIAERLIRFDMKAINRTAGTPSAQAQAHGLNGNPFGWCRGLLGIALMALQAGTVRIGADARWLNKIADGIIANGTEGPLCLCHGALGQLEFLAVMADQGLLRDPQGAAAWRRQLLARIVGGDWVADSGHRLESPGLMVGLAGTGYSLLRAARSQSLPSVLTIEV